MKPLSLLLNLSAITACVASLIEVPPNVPRNIDEFRQKHPLQRRATGCHRKVVKIKASTNDLDDISDEFVEGLKQANNGGTLYLEHGKTFIIGRPLDLTFLNDIHIRLEGEIKVNYQTRLLFLFLYFTK
jgi:galacturan 1,4-alpha-galacturonidase